MPQAKININFVICRTNFREMADMVRFGKELEVDQISLAPVHTNLQHKCKPLDDFSDLIPKEEDMPELRREIAKLKQAARAAGMRISSSQFLDGIPRFFTELSHWHTCFAGYISCAVSPWGDVSPCSDLDSNLNVRNRPLHEIWRSEEFEWMRENVHMCERHCWDTTNTEMAIRCSMKGLLKELPRILKDFSLYRSAGK